MKFLANLGTTGQVAVGAVAVAAAGALGYGLYQMRPQPEEVVVAPPVSEPAPAAEPAAPAEPETAQTEPEQEAEPEVAEEPPQPVAPTFDVVRIEPDGDALVAGAAEPEALVEILVDGNGVFETPADRAGKFVALFDLLPSPEPRLLTLSMSTKAGDVIQSESFVIIEGVAPVVVAEAPAEVEPVPEVETAAEPEAIAQAETPVEEAPADEAPADEAPVEEAPATEVPAEETPAEEVIVAELPDGTAPNATDTVPDETAAVPPEAQPGQVPVAGGPTGATSKPGTSGAPDNPGTGDVTADPRVATAPAEPPQGEQAAPEADAPQVATAVPAAESPVSETANTPETPVEQVVRDETVQPDTTPAPVEDPAQVAEEVVEPNAPQAVAEAPAAPETAVDQPAVPDEVETVAADPAQAAQEAPEAAPAVVAEAPSAPTNAPAETVPERGPSVIIADKSGVRVLPQAGNATAREIVQEVVVDAISYSEDGGVNLTGRGAAENFVRLYLNNKALATEEIGLDGRWSSKSSDIAPGLYTLRVDQLNGEGDVTSRFETPFKREEPAALAAANALKARPNQSGVAVVTVQPGFTLWAIARENYGDGVQYVAVYEANKAQIRDPDLIYPGQIFRVPGAE
ncbi:hypothetical protein ACMU_13265 [Actibacterium mucosum KCTC 23349]|uniref:LysM domain-containing protein n=1 Tax=Actibacterium mucosum KCTC 23349 TaxID=1454373 RepID=A0A037ZGR8_9RHOB|nr:LysM peptidoglycan-binding domain-containing protein [Actibacterium mucosum]KAJ55655.1 hypothetical protein ACMU_13265 [Actibacterium mucosum KCTC 23349]